MPQLSENNADGYFAKGIIKSCVCRTLHRIVDIEMTRDGGLYSDLVSCPCGTAHWAQDVLDCGEMDTETEPRNYVMVDPGNHAEEIHAESEGDAVCQLIRWAEIDGHPYSGHFYLREIDGDGDQGATVWEHESERGGESE